VPASSLLEEGDKGAIRADLKPLSLSRLTVPLGLDAVGAVLPPQTATPQFGFVSHEVTEVQGLRGPELGLALRKP
jgi:hypothetical protein